MKTLEGDKSIVSGGGTNSNVVEASHHGTHKFVNFSDSILYGNRFRDIVLAQSDDTGNTIHTGGGNDKIISKGDNNTAILGKGDDQYHLKGGTGHQVEFGAGKDTFIIHKSKKNSFYIADFDYIEDKFEFKGGLSGNNFKTKLINPGDQTNLDGASLEFYNGKSKLKLRRLIEAVFL